ncbi:MAG: 5-bromo-4-chloroindolyl phosphate hydrolysis family protein [Defluviitaleaceae bacterium]|nr:5-bromo-4-chloroindolyl phosphate hydrolysis family protein [Defluviitaleaceae bacterium]
MIEKKVKSTMPIYAAGIVFVTFSLLFPIYTLLSLALAAFFSVGIGVVVSTFSPAKTIMVEAPFIPAKTGDDRLNTLINEGREKLKDIDRMSKTINNKRVLEDVGQMKLYGEKIFHQLELYPEKAGYVRQFMDYYLPTSYKLIENYVNFKSQGAAGENIDKATAKIEEALDVTAIAFKKQFDNMFESKAMDIIAEANVMERLLKSGGLLDDELMKLEPKKEDSDE